MNIIGISGGLTQSSRTSILVREILSQLHVKFPFSSIHFVPLAGVARELGGVLWRSEVLPSIEQQLQAIELADVIVLACPVYRASYPGLFKHFLDFVERKGFEKKVVLLAACGGSQHHSLIIEQQLRPLVSGLGAFSVPTGIYTEAKDYAQDSLINPSVLARIESAIDEAVHLLRLSDKKVHSLDVVPQPQAVSSL